MWNEREFPEKAAADVETVGVAVLEDVADRAAEERARRSAPNPRFAFRLENPTRGDQQRRAPCRGPPRENRHTPARPDSAVRVVYQGGSIMEGTGFSARVYGARSGHDEVQAVLTVDAEGVVRGQTRRARGGRRRSTPTPRRRPRSASLFPKAPGSGRGVLCRNHRFHVHHRGKSTAAPIVLARQQRDGPERFRSHADEQPRERLPALEARRVNLPANRGAAHRWGRKLSVPCPVQWKPPSVSTMPLRWSTAARPGRAAASEWDLPTFPDEPPRLGVEEKSVGLILLDHAHRESRQPCTSNSTSIVKPGQTAQPAVPRAAAVDLDGSGPQHRRQFEGGPTRATGRLAGSVGKTRSPNR